jgi:hypothetical protein
VMASMRRSGSARRPNRLHQLYTRLTGSFAQRYVKRHARVRKRADTRRLRWFLFPHFLVRFQDGFWERPPMESGTFRRTRRTSGRVDVFPKPWNWERRNMNRLSGGKPRETCSSTVFGNRCSDLTPREGFKNECARQRGDGLKDAMCATRVVFKGTGTIWLRCHRSRRQDREAADAPPDRIRTAPRNQPGTAGPVHVALRTFEQRPP